MTIRKLFEGPLGKSLFPAATAAAALLGCFTLTGTGSAADQKPVQGVLLDMECSPNAETRLVGGTSPHLEGGMLWAYTHKRSCLLMPSCRRSGYGIFTYDDDKFLKFDAAGNAKATALIQASKKDDDNRIEATGDIQGDTIKVSTLKILP